MDKKFFFLQLIPFRTSFTQDMTEVERAVMQEHVTYWTPHVEAGTMIVMGPVADPEGGWGLGVIGVDSENKLNELLRKDPAIAIGHWEVLPMRSIRYNAS